MPLERATTSASGTYSFVNLNPRFLQRHRLESRFPVVHAKNDVDVQIGGATRVNITLPVGNAAETVTVTAVPPLNFRLIAPSLGGSRGRPASCVGVAR